MTVFTQWLGVLGAPLVWLVYLQINYALSPLACDGGNKLPLVLVNVLALVALTGPVFAAWRTWQAAGANADTEAGGAIGRSSFMALLGLGMSVLFGAVILAGAVPLIFLGVCD